MPDIQIKPKETKAGVDFIINRFNNSKNFQTPLFNKYIQYYKLYRSIRDSNMQNYRGRARLFVPYVFQTIETIMPRLVGGKPKIECIPREASDMENASVFSKLVDYQWDQMEMKKKIKDWVKQGLLYGNSVLKLTWKYDKDYDGPCAEVCDNFDIYVDPDAESLKSANYVIHRLERNIDKLKSDPKYKLPKELETETSQDTYKIQRDATMGMSKPSNKDKKLVELLEYWGLYDFGEGLVPALIVVANRKYIIRAQKNPYHHQRKPFIDFVDMQMPNERAAIGEVEQLESLQYELNDVRNQRMDNVTLILNRMWKVAKGADVDESDLVSQAGQIVHCGDINGVAVIDTPDVTQSSYNEESLIKSDMQQASGVTDYSKGGGSGGKGNTTLGNETATGIMLLQEAGNARFKFKLDNLEDSLKEFGEQLIALDQQFVKQEMVVRIVGEQGTTYIKMSPKDIKGNYDIIVEAGSTQPMSKSVRRAEARELLVTLAPIAQAAGINLKYLVKYLLKTYDLADSDEIFLQPQGNMVAPEQFAAMAGAQGAAFGANSGAGANVSLQRMGGNGLPNAEENIAAQRPTGAQPE